MTTHRQGSGGRIDRRKSLSFRFDGKTYNGFAGDTLASALIANGVVLMGRSFKYHRKRGPIAAGVEEPNALVTVTRANGRHDSNLRASVIELYEGLVATSQNRWPSLETDIGRVNDALAPLFSAGFYYKTFMWPKSFWKSVYEPNIRKAAGLGKAPSKPDPDHYQNRHAHCDVLIVGAGSAGLAAALSASESGARVILADEQAELGGSLLHEHVATIDTRSAEDWLQGALATLQSRSNITLLSRTTVVGHLNQNHMIASQRLTDHLPVLDTKTPRERLWQIRAKQVVLATGAHERPLIFPDNDRPGIMLAEAGRIYLNRYGARLGDAIIVFTTCDSAYRVARDFKRAGTKSVTIIDGRAKVHPALAAEAVAEGVAVIPDAVVIGTTGGSRINAARISTGGGSEQVITCDGLLMSGGWTPAVHLFSQSRGTLRFDEALNAFVPGVSRQAEQSAGACKGDYTLEACLEGGFHAGAKAAEMAGGKPVRVPDVKIDGDAGTAFTPMPLVPLPKKTGLWSRAWIDFQNDVTAKDIKLAIQEGFTSVEHFKRFTTNGMATDQGKTSNMNAIGIASNVLGQSAPAIGTTTFRMPYTPVTFGALIGPNRGALFDPARKTPIYAWALKNGASFEDVGLWKRAWYFPQTGETMHRAVMRECRAVREKVGIFDASTLGKIEVVGKDAAAFLNLMYVNNFDKLAVGKCRYGLMLKDDGFIYDDGIIARIAPDRFHVTTTTGGAPRVMHLMEDYLQTEFTTLDVQLTSISEQWAVIAVQGPKARDVIAPLVAGVDVSDTGLPPMGYAEGTICGVPMRLFRASFTGEVGYEINVPADHGEAVWEAAFEAGKSHGITPYGTEAMHVLRAERGFIIVGQETDGTVTPDDVGLGGMVSKVKPDFVGKRGLMRPDLLAEGRKQLVGLLTKDAALVLDEGAQIVLDVSQPKPMTMVGHVTSSYESPALGRSIAMALLKDGRAKHGETVFVTTKEGFTAAVVGKPVFFDEEGKRVQAAAFEPVLPKAIEPAGRRSCLAIKKDMGSEDGPVWIKKLGPMSRFNVKGKGLLVASRTVLSLPFDQPVNRAIMAGDCASLRLGPSEWLITGPDASHASMVAALNNLPGSVVDVSHRNVALLVSGPMTMMVLNSGNPLDLELAAFPIGMATRTVLGKAEVVLWRQADDVFHVECWRSFGPYLYHFLAEAAREFL
jgi:sarcosine oxidase, subunit alpha